MSSNIEIYGTLGPKHKAVPRERKMAHDLVHIIHRQRQYMATEIDRWRQAVNLARSNERPRRLELGYLLEDLERDNHLTSIKGKRIMAVTGAKWVIVDKEGKELSDLMHIFDKEWFYGWMQEVICTRLYGHTVLTWDVMKHSPSVPRVIPRGQVVPELRSYIPDPNFETLVRYDDPALDKWVIELGSQDDLGIMWKAGPEVIYKNYSRAAWSEYTEIYGVPPRIAKVPAYFEQHQLLQVDNALAQMGRAAYGRFPDGVDIQFPTTGTSTDVWQVFDKHVERSNSEMSKLILGQTMTTDNGSSRSQADVHQDESDKITADDMKQVAMATNDKLISFLKRHGIRIPEGASFRWHEAEDLADVRKSITELSQYFTVPVEFVQDKLGIPVEPKQQPVADPQPDPEPKPEPKAKAAFKLPGAVMAYYRHQHPVSNEVPKSLLAKLQMVINSLAKAIFDGTAPDNSTELSSVLQQIMVEATDAGWPKPDISYNSPDLVRREVLRSSAWAFADAKAQAELVQIRKALANTETWNEFLGQVQEINEQYNRNWLRTEYNQAQLSSEAAANWMQYEMDKEAFPYLQYDTVGDDRVREKHADLDGLVRPIDDPIWDVIYPPNGWGCRCDVTQVDEDAQPTDQDEAYLLAELASTDPKFRTNVGKTLSVLPADHPYMSGRRELTWQDFGLASTEDWKPVDISDRDPADILYEMEQDDVYQLLDYRGIPALLRPGLADMVAADREAINAMATAVSSPSEHWTRTVANRIYHSYLVPLQDGIYLVEMVNDRTEIRITQAKLLTAAEANAIRKGVRL